MVVLATAIVSLNGNWNLKGWPTPRRGAVRTLDAVPAAGAVRFTGQGVAKIRYSVEGDAESYDSHYLYGGPTQKYVGEKKISFADYRRWTGL